MTSSTCSPEYASKRTRVLLGCYRKGECGDPEVYVPAVASVLARYSTDVVRAVTDPADGLPSQSSWLPTVAEVRKGCEAEAARAHRAAQIEAKRKAPRLPPPDEPSQEARDRAIGRWETIKAGILASNLVARAE